MMKEQRAKCDKEALMSKATKWYLFYVVHDSWRDRDEIRAREFDTELDMLIFWSKNPRTKSVNMHHVVSPDGLTKVPNDLYERIEVLKRELVEKEKKVEKEVELSERDKRVKVARANWKARQTRKAKQQEAQCTQGQ
jgi:hypothetical protein